LKHPRIRTRPPQRRGSDTIGGPLGTKHTEGGLTTRGTQQPWPGKNAKG